MCDESILDLLLRAVSVHHHRTHARIVVRQNARQPRTDKSHGGASSTPPSDPDLLRELLLLRAAARLIITRAVIRPPIGQLAPNRRRRSRSWFAAAVPAQSKVLSHGGTSQVVPSFQPYSYM